MENPKEPNQLTQEEVYTLWHAYAGYLNAVERNCLDKVLSEMDYPEQEVRDIRVVVGDRCYRVVIPALDALLAREAAGVCKPPPAPKVYRTRGDRAREAVVAGAEAGRAWRELIKRAKEPAKIAVKEEIDA